MLKEKVILEGEPFSLLLERLCSQIIERYHRQSQVFILGIQSSGFVLSSELVKILKHMDPKLGVQHGALDITFYRDDFRRGGEMISAKSTNIEFNVEEKPIILVDDVLYSGRTVSSALTAIGDLGRPSKIELLVLVDRRFNRHFPIQPQYTGITVDTLDNAYIRVGWDFPAGDHKIYLLEDKPRRDVI